MKLHLISSKGASRAVVLLVMLIVTLLAVMTVVYVFHLHDQADATNCNIAIEKAERMLENGTVGQGTLNLDEAKAIIDKSKWEREALCPAGGDYYVVEEAGAAQPHRIVCGIHGSDSRERCRLNAQAARAHVDAALQDAAKRGEEVPASVTFTLNGKELTAECRADKMDRGTWITEGYEGTVAFYQVDDEGMTSFSFADEENAANWTRRGGWS